MNDTIIKTIEQFMIKTISSINSEIFNMPYIKFVFSEEALTEMEKITNNIEYEDDKKIALSSLDILKKTRVKYLEKKEEEYIIVNDYKKFFYLLTELKKAINEHGFSRNFTINELYRSIWLRMNPSDLENVEGFLRRQISFAMNDDIFGHCKETLHQYGDIYIRFENRSNEDWFETNNNIRFSIEQEEETESDDLFSIFHSYKSYSLPSIHYGLIKENNEAVCYIYGIQNLDNYTKQDEDLKKIIQGERKRLRNSTVSPDFIITLKLFIDLLYSRGITKMKIPLMQNFNYIYHEYTSNKYKEKLAEYTEEQKEKYMDEYNNGNRDNDVVDYMIVQDCYNMFADKEDIISKNKTERFIETFMIMKEKYDNIEILNEPFIHSDNLIIDILPTNEKTNWLFNNENNLTK